MIAASPNDRAEDLGDRAQGYGRLYAWRDRPTRPTPRWRCPPHDRGDGASAAVNAVYYNKIQEQPEPNDRRTSPNCRTNIGKTSTLRLASDLIVDAVVAPNDLRAELANALPPTHQPAPAG